MKPTTRLWLDKAEADYTGALDLRRARRPSSRDLICFHCQQAVEKYLKARLVEAGITFPKTHDLTLLLKLIAPVEPLWMALSGPLSVLSAYAIELRYPGRGASAAEVRGAVHMTERLRKMAMERLGVTTTSPRRRSRARRKP
jgi:HEPN domain-containing protein